jgi:hypothetical protein
VTVSRLCRSRGCWAPSATLALRPRVGFRKPLAFVSPKTRPANAVSLLYAICCPGMGSAFQTRMLQLDVAQV